MPVGGAALRGRDAEAPSLGEPWAPCEPCLPYGLHWLSCCCRGTAGGQPELRRPGAGRQGLGSRGLEARQGG